MTALPAFLIGIAVGLILGGLLVIVLVALVETADET